MISRAGGQCGLLWTSRPWSLPLEIPSTVSDGLGGDSKSEELEASGRNGGVMRVFAILVSKEYEISVSFF